MIAIQHKLKSWSFSLVAVLLSLSACNKEVEQFAEAPITQPSGLTLGETIAATPTDSLYYRLIIKSGLLPVISSKANSYTMFVPDNNGMKLFINVISGGQVPLAAPDAVFSGFITANIPAASAAGIVSYNIVPQKILSTNIPTTFPNFQLPTSIILDPTNPFVRMTTFPAKGATYSYVNNIPITAVDAAVANGVIHHTATIVAPPTNILAGLIYADTSLSYFTAAVARADSGQVGLNRIDSLLKYAVTNMTVLAPSNTAFRSLIYGVAFGSAIAQGAPPNVAANLASGAVALGPAIFTIPDYNAILPASSVQGIIGYHLLASPNPTSGAYEPNIRVFSTDFPPASATPFFVKTLVNSAFASHPGILVNATFTGPVVTDLSFTGLGTFPPGGVPYSGAAAKAVTFDKHAVNGVLHIIDKVLLPQ
jgi:uncharacterized surface protein with fasciclin (FAS1) repeats